MTSIGEDAFRGCTGLTSLTIPDSVTNIMYGAFSYCSGLASIMIGNGVTTIGQYAFENSGLTSILIPASVTNIAEFAFARTALKTVWLPISYQYSHLFSSSWYTIVRYVAEKGVAIPISWFDEAAASLVAASGGDYEAAARVTAANGRPVWECYVADLDPEDADDDLAVSIGMADGEPVVTILKGESANRVYTTQGAPAPGGPWDDLEDGADWDAAGYRFFRVKVSLPE